MAFSFHTSHLSGRKHLSQKPSEVLLLQLIGQNLVTLISDHPTRRTEGNLPWPHVKRLPSFSWPGLLQEKAQTTTAFNSSPDMITPVQPPWRWGSGFAVAPTRPTSSPGSRDWPLGDHGDQCHCLCTPWKESYDQPRQHIKKQRHCQKGPSSQGYGFPSSHVWMWELDYKGS